MPPLRLLRLVLLGACVVSSATAQSARDARKLYADFCASCHGANLQGGTAPALLGETWKHGSTDEALTASIRNGTSGGMPGFGESLSEIELRGLVVYLREQGARAASQRRPSPRPDTRASVTGKHHAFRLETVFNDLTDPWSLAFLPGDRALITEKHGTLRLAEKGVLRPEPISGTPAIDSSGQAGLFDVVPHPDFARNGWIYLAFSDPQKNADGQSVCMTAIVRGRIKDNAWVDQEVVFRAPVERYGNAGGVHYGGRLAFDKNNFLFFSIGDRGDMHGAQNLSLPNGKIHRLHDDGRIPADNPFAQKSGAFPSIWTYGNRNPQGLRIHPATGELWAHEHGPRGGDELNLLRPGLNYGWPVATYGMNYNGTPMNAVTTRPDITPPVHFWVPSIAPCGMAFYTGDRFPKWKNHLFIASLAAEELVRMELKDGKVVDQEVVFKGAGRQRDVITGPDGFLYVLFQNRIDRLVPVSP